MIIVVGAGNIGRELLAKISRDFDLTCIDVNPRTEALVEKVRGKERTKVIIGDATSRLVLERARVDESEAVLITSTTEKINLEVARVLKDHFTPRRVISVAITDEGAAELVRLGVEVMNIFTASANDMRNLIEHRVKTAHGIGIGRNEILEVEVHPNSRLRNRPIGSIAPIRWNMGIIYRDGNIVIPRPETVLKEGDKVVVLGDPVVLKTVAEMLGTEFQRFPLEFGTEMILYLAGGEDDAFFEEARYIYSVFQLSKVAIVYAASAERVDSQHEAIAVKCGCKDAGKFVSSLSPVEAVRSAVLTENDRPGLVVVSRRAALGRFGGLIAGAGRSGPADMAAAAGCPVIVTGGTFPYERLVVPALGNDGFRNSLETAIEISHTITGEVAAVVVRPSQYLGSEEERAAFEETKQIVSNIGFVHRKKIDLRLVDGNPVQQVVRAVREDRLLVLDGRDWARRGFVRSLLLPDVAGDIVRRSRISTLVLPGLGELLRR
jgi:Trk K+ transport system NAD-binding subunit/nucleotide-binding universal stress UspA family protein